MRIKIPRIEWLRKEFIRSLEKTKVQLKSDLAFRFDTIAFEILRRAYATGNKCTAAFGKSWVQRRNLFDTRCVTRHGPAKVLFILSSVRPLDTREYPHATRGGCRADKTIHILKLITAARLLRNCREWMSRHDCTFDQFEFIIAPAAAAHAARGKQV